SWRSLSPDVLVLLAGIIAAEAPRARRAHVQERKRCGPVLNRASRAPCRNGMQVCRHTAMRCVEKHHTSAHHIFTPERDFAAAFGAQGWQICSPAGRTLDV